LLAERSLYAVSIVNSVLGSLDTKDLGFTLMHEHGMSQGFVAQNYPELFIVHRFMFVEPALSPETQRAFLVEQKSERKILRTSYYFGSPRKA
jgi:predicted metal-dependent phosphotriesterase family hydrolase